MEESSPAVREEYVASPFGPSAVGKTDPVALDREDLKLLASDTRLDILKALRQRRMTVSELSASLALGKSTVFEHLNKLVDGGMVVRHDDPDREWVYYELAPKSRRLFSPVSAKIVLMLSSVVGLALAALVAFSLYSAAGPGLHVEVEGADAPLLAGEATVLDLRVTSDGSATFGDAEVALVARDAYQAFREGAPLDGRPLAPERLDDGRLRVRVAFPPGDHHLVATAGDLASGDGSGAVRVTSAVLHADPSPVLLGADAGRPVRVWVTHEGRVLEEGTLLVEGDAATFQQSRTRAFNDPIETVRLDLRQPGEARFSWRPAADGSFFAPVEGTLPVEWPQVSVAPSHLVEGTRTTLTVTVWHDVRGAVEDAPVRVEVGDKVVATRATDVRGVALLDVEADSGEAVVRVGDLVFARVPVVRLAVVDTALTSLGLEVWAEDLETGTPLANAAVEVNGVEVARTDVHGHALVTERGAVVLVAEGYAPYGLALPGYEATAVHWVSKAKSVAETDALAPLATVTELDLAASTARVPSGGVVHVTAVFRNPGDRAIVETAVLTVDGARWSAQDVPLAPGETRTIEFPVLLREAGVHRLSVNRATALEVEVVPEPATVVAASAGDAATPTPWTFALVGAAVVAFALRRR